MKGAILCTAVTSGTLRCGDVDFKVHVLGDGRRVVEVTDIETLLGLPSSGLGDFLAALPGTDRVRFRVLDPKAPLADPWHVGILAEKVAEMLIAFWQANNGTEAGARAGRIVRDVVKRGMRVAGVDPVNADWLMAAAMPPKGER